jgi:hypothetical protein
MPTHEQYGAHIGVSRQAAREYFKKHGLKQSMTITAFRQHYCATLRERAAGRIVSSEALDLTVERARREKEAADKLEMENAVTRGELVSAEEVEEMWGGEFSRVKNKLLAVPPKIAPLMIGVKTPEEAQETIKAVIYEALNELSQPTYRDDDA